MTKQADTKRLWKLCFNDSDKFIEFYFKEKYQDINTFAMYNANIMHSVLQSIPYKINALKTDIDAGYVSGACTIPQARNKGLMTDLLKIMFKSLYSRHIPISFLIPQENWLYDFYKKTGYSPKLYNCNEKFTRTNTCDAFNYQPNEKLKNKLYSIYLKFSRKENCVIHSKNDFLSCVDETLISGGKILYTGEKEQPSAFCFVSIESHNILITEIEGTDKEKEHLLNATCSLFNIPFINYQTFSSNQNLHGMLRIIDAKHLLQIFAKQNPDICINIQILDKDIDNNNKTFSLQNGNCEITTQKPDKEIPISELAEIIFAEGVFINLMME